MKNIVITLIALVSLTACTQSVSLPTAQQRQEELRLSCLNEAEYTTRLKKAAYQKKYGSKRSEFVQDTDETKRQKSLCRKMTKANSYEQKIALADECRQEAVAGLKANPEYRQHYDAMQSLCTKMTVK